MGERWYESGPSWSQIFMWGFWLKAYVFVGLGWFYDIQALRDVGMLFGVTAVALTVQRCINGHDAMVRRELRRAREAGEESPAIRLMRKS